jgi:hypothetical protein
MEEAALTQYIKRRIKMDAPWELVAVIWFGIGVIFSLIAFFLIELWEEWKEEMK